MQLARNQYIIKILKDLTIIIPAKEDSESLPIILKELKFIKSKKIIVMRKEDIYTYNSIKKINCNVLFQKGKGYGNAIIEGIINVRTKYLAIMYADGSTDPRYLKLMLNRIKEEGKSLIFCSRYQKYGGSFDDTIMTRIGNFFFTLLGNILFSLKLSDILFTYVLGETKSFKKMNLKSNDYCLCAELPIKAKKFNIKYTSMPCIERKRIAGKKKIKEFSDGIKILKFMLNVYWKL